MSLLRQFSTRHLLIAAMICIPLFLEAQSTNRTKKKARAKAEQTQPADPSRPDYKSIGSPLPPVRVVYHDKAVFTDESLKNDANLFVMMFNPTCSHCEEMAINMTRNLDLFNKSHILLIAGSGMTPYLEFFENGTKVNNFYPKIKLGVDSSDFINNTFTYEPLPQINIYSPERKLIRIFTGITTIDSLKPYIQ